jgi:hypothetical protein
MKLLSVLAAGLLTAFAASSFSAYAAEEAKTETKSEAPAAKKMKPHSHMEERGLASPSRASEESDTAATPKKNPAKDKAKHLHPRDGK